MDIDYAFNWQNLYDTCVMLAKAHRELALATDTDDHNEIADEYDMKAAEALDMIKKIEDDRLHSSF